MIIDKNGLTFKNLIDQEIFSVEKVDELSCHIVLENENVIVFDISSQTINNILFDSIDSAINYINEKKYLNQNDSEKTGPRRTNGVHKPTT